MDRGVGKTTGDCQAASYHNGTKDKRSQVLHGRSFGFACYRCNGKTYSTKNGAAGIDLFELISEKPIGQRWFFSLL
jgi:hypothetical protein